MSTTNEKIDKLIEASQKRDEARVYLSKYFLANQDSLSQNLLRGWKNFEQLSEEVKAEEAEEIKRLEQEISEQQKIEGENAKFIALFPGYMRCTLIILMAELLVGILLGDPSQQFPKPNNYNGCTGSSIFSMC